MKRYTAILLALAAASSPQVLLAEGNPEAGKAKSAICATCHGANGIATMPSYPNLAGQNAEYLESALKAYRSKERQGGLSMLMHAQAASLSDEDIADLAAFYAGM